MRCTRNGLCPCAGNISSERHTRGAHDATADGTVRQVTTRADLLQGAVNMECCCGTHTPTGCVCRGHCASTPG